MRNQAHMTVAQIIINESYEVGGISLISCTYRSAYVQMEDVLLALPKLFMWLFLLGKAHKWAGSPCSLSLLTYFLTKLRAYPVLYDPIYCDISLTQIQH